MNYEMWKAYLQGLIWGTIVVLPIVLLIVWCVM